MKTLHKIFFLAVLAIGFTFVACSDDDDKITGTPLMLEASADEIELTETDDPVEVLTFTWNKGLDLPGDYTVSYIFRLDVASGDFSESTEPEVIDDFKRTFTNIELNKIAEKLGVYPGETATLQARVVAKVEGPKFMYPEIAYADLTVHTYVVQPKPLYLIGNATSAGSNPEQAPRMNEIEIGNYYEWEGVLKEGSFKLLTSRESLLPSLNKGADNNTLVERKSENDPDNLFEVSVESNYRIKVYREEMKIDYEVIVPYPDIFLIGDAGTGWDLPGNMHRLVMNPDNPNLFELEIRLNAGEFKFLTAEDWGAHTFRPMENDGSISDTAMQGYAGGDDKKWRVHADEAGNYKITMDVYNMKIYFEKL